jgi:hypothetical protein
MADDATVRERVQELTWALLDEQITEDEKSLLDTLLLSDDKARRCYLECVTLHADLMGHFSEKPAGAKAGTSNVLSFLGNVPTDFPPSHASN